MSMDEINVENEKEIIYCNRVRIGNWYEASVLEESRLNVYLKQLKKGDLMLARFRKMTENLNSPTILTQSTGSIAFGAKISLYAPYVPSPDVTTSSKDGLLLGGRISSDDIPYSQELEDGCSIVGLPYTVPRKRNAFILTSADYCDRTGELLKYNQEFLLKLASSVDKQPLYMRYDPDPIPGLCGPFTLYLSKHFVSNTRWKVLPVQRPDITRFEQEGICITVNQDVVINHCATNLNLGINSGCRAVGFYGKVNQDVVINHCATNLNLGINLGFWVAGFHGKICAPLLKTCLDVYGRELPSNIWQIHTPLNTQS